jgi:hypothetical protein
MPMVVRMFGPARQLALALFAATPWSVDDALCRR